MKLTVCAKQMDPSEDSIPRAKADGFDALPDDLYEDLLRVSGTFSKTPARSVFDSDDDEDDEWGTFSRVDKKSVADGTDEARAKPGGGESDHSQESFHQTADVCVFNLARLSLIPTPAAPSPPSPNPHTQIIVTATPKQCRCDLIRL